MTSYYVLPVSFPELAEVELSHFGELTIPLIVPDVSFLEIFLRKIHALKLIEKTDIPQRSICGAG
jgi:hypothetical protein